MFDEIKALRLDCAKNLGVVFTTNWLFDRRRPDTIPFS
jgi:hypothetical protein